MQENHSPETPCPTGRSTASGLHKNPNDEFRSQLQSLSQEWLCNGTPAYQELDTMAVQLEKMKKALAIKGIWTEKPLMVTATLDDGLGQGLRTIHRYGDIIGLEIYSLGLLQTPETIIAACRRLRPRFLGLTVLQLDSDDDLGQIGKSLPRETSMIAGGPVFQYDPDMAQRCGVVAVCPNVAHFIDFMCRQA
jgi:hypothetical protein